MTIPTFNEFYNISSIKCKKLDLTDDLNAIDGKVYISFE
jgi:hypothetical protein